MRRISSLSGRILAMGGLLAVLLLLAAAVTGCDVFGGGAPGPVGPGGSTSGTSSVEATVPIPLAGTVVPGSGIYLGAYVPPAPFDLSALEAFESMTSKRPAIVMWFQPWAANNRSRPDLGTCAKILARGQVPLITWEPWNPGTNSNQVKDPGANPEYRLSRIVAGDFDDYIRGWARDLKRLGGPVMLRPMHEMNGNWYPWCGTVNGNTPQDFVAAWRHIHDIFAEEGATNVTWVWSINHESVPATKANRYAAYYPGDAYVDWTSISGFNWGTSSSVSSWHTWSYWYTAPLAYLNTLGKPICISEIASVEQGGNKGAWITDAYRRMATVPGIRAVVYFDANETGGSANQDWRVTTSAQSLAAFNAAISAERYSSGPVDALAAWQAQLSASDRAQLASFPVIY